MSDTCEISKEVLDILIPRIRNQNHEIVSSVDYGKGSDYHVETLCRFTDGIMHVTSVKVTKP